MANVTVSDLVDALMRTTTQQELADAAIGSGVAVISPNYVQLTDLSETPGSSMPGGLSSVGQQLFYRNGDGWVQIATL